MPADFKDLEIMRKAIGCCIEVEKILGPTLIERAYQIALIRELELNGFKVETERPIDFDYKGVLIPNAFRADIIVDNQLIIELKAVDDFQPYHHLQLRTYMKLLSIPYGLLVNFHKPHLINGGLSRKSIYDNPSCP